MKILIGADGTSWESAVARRLEKAVWYLIINVETLEREVYQNVPPHDHCNILLLASRQRVPVIVAGGMDAATARLMLSLNLRFGAVARMNVRQALETVTTGLATDCQPLEVQEELRDRRYGTTQIIITMGEAAVIRWHAKRYRGDTPRTASPSTIRWERTLVSAAMCL